MSSFRTRARTPAALLMLALAAAGCDVHGDPVVVVPEFDDVTTFETDLGKWVVKGADLGVPPVSYEGVRSTDRAQSGTQSVRLRLDNQAGQGKVILERRYEVEKNQRYLVEISLRFASADWGGVTPPWRLLLGAAPDSPTKTAVWNDPFDTANERVINGGFVWLTQAITFPAVSDADGELFVYVGVQGSSAGSRTYYVDDVQVVLTRDGITTAPKG